MPLGNERKRKASGDVGASSNGQVSQPLKRKKSKACSTTTMLSHIWLLRARAFDGDVRSKEATELKAYLVAGKTYVVGSNDRVADVVVKEDKTVSRTHATLRVITRHGEKNQKSGGDLSRDDRGGDCEGTTYVEVVDTSSHGRTYLSEDMRGILKAQRIRDKSRSGSAQAYHGYFMMLGQMSPFRLTRVPMGVYLSGDVAPSVTQAIRDLGMRVVEGEEGLERAGASVRVVVGGVRKGGKGRAKVSRGDCTGDARGAAGAGGDALVDVRDDILLGMVVGAPVVTGGWAQAWQEEGREPTRAPREEDYGVSVVGRNGNVVHTTDYEKEKVMEGLLSRLGGFRLGCVSGVASGALVAAARGLGLGVDVLEGRDDIEDWVLGCVKTPLMVFRKQGDVRMLPQPPCAYCLVEDLRFALLDGEVEGLVRCVGESLSKKSPMNIDSKDKIAAGGMMEPSDEEGWHDALRNSPSLSVRAEETEIDEDVDEHPVYTMDAPMIVKKEGSKSKMFKKKHHVPGIAEREVISVVGDRPSAQEEEKEWLEIEQERQAMMEAFDKQGLVIGAKKKATRRK